MEANIFVWDSLRYLGLATSTLCGFCVSGPSCFLLVWSFLITLVANMLLYICVKPVVGATLLGRWPTSLVGSRFAGLERMVGTKRKNLMARSLLAWRDSSALGGKVFSRRLFSRPSHTEVFQHQHPGGLRPRTTCKKSEFAYKDVVVTAKSVFGPRFVFANFQINPRACPCCGMRARACSALSVSECADF